MRSFRFLHAADIHLDSPLYGLSRYEGLPAEEIRGATRAAFDNLVQLAIDEAVDFVLIAGDLFDGDWKHMGTGLYFARAMGRLDQAGICAFILAGNHDAASVITRSVPWPPNVRLFDTHKPETHVLTELGVALHGQSFHTAAVTENLVTAYPEARPHTFNIGLLHTALSGRQGHAPYAPCSLEDLKSKHYDYWALGHVHEHEIVSDHPHVVFPGNTQGRTIREVGPKGAVLVTVEDGQVAELRHVELDVIRWAAVEVDCTGASAAEAADRIRAALLERWHDHPSQKPLVARLTLTGATAEAGAFLDRAGGLRDDARAVAASISPDLLIEKVRVRVSPPLAVAVVGEGDAASTLGGGDLTRLIEHAASDPRLAEALREDLEPFLLAAQTSLGPPEEADLRAAATQEDWQSVLTAAGLALRSRLSGAA